MRNLFIVAIVVGIKLNTTAISIVALLQKKFILLVMNTIGGYSTIASLNKKPNCQFGRAGINKAWLIADHLQRHTVTSFLKQRAESKSCK